MSDLPSITCVMPAFNYERYVSAAIESVLGQDYPPELLDLVVVDDGSSDGTADVIRGLLVDAGGRLRLIQQPNLGVMAATRTALEHVTGELIALCDADDLWLAGKARAQAELFAADPDVTLSYGDMQVVDRDGVVLKPSFFADMGVEFHEGHVIEQLLEQDFAPNSTVVLRAGTVRPFPARMPFQDYWLVACAGAAGKTAAIRRPLTSYRLHGANQGFGSTGDAEVRKLMRELLGRRLIIAELFGSVSAEALVQIVDRLIAKAIWVSTLGSRSVEEVLDIDPDERLRAARELERAGTVTDAEERLRTLALALALDPFNAAARDAVLAELSARVASRRPIRVGNADRPLVSVIVPAFNHARFLPAAIDSALGQQLRTGSVEVIVVDDGSTDETPAVMARYGDRIRAVRQANGGINAPINTALGLVNGRYVAVLDADDTWPADRLARHIDVLDAHPEVGLVQGDMAVMDEHGQVTEPSFFASRRMTPSEGRVLGALLGGNFVSGGASTFRADLIPAMHPIDAASVYPDWWIAVCVAAVAEIRLAPGIANHYRRHGANNSLGRDGLAEQVHVQRRELPWRRWMFANMLADQTVTAEQIRAAYASFRFGLVAAGMTEQTGARGLLGPDSEAAAAILRALPAAGPGAPRSRRLLEALAHDPFDGAAAIDLEIALQRELPLPQQAAPPPLISLATREHLCLAWLPEVIRQPELLRAFARDTTSRDDTTVAVLAPPGADLEPLVRIFENDPALNAEEYDFTVISEPSTPPARSLLAARAGSRLTWDDHRAPFDQLPIHPAAERATTTV